MSLLDRLKSFLGLARPSEPAQEQPVAVTVEREAGTAASDDRSTRAAAAEEGSTSTAEAAEPSTAAVEPDDTTAPTESQPTESEDEPEKPAEPEAAEPEAPEDAPGDDSPVTEISGIGPAYSERLANANITTVSELAAADASELASEVDVSETRLAGWIEAARERADGE